jgi:hypothetical protein
MERALKGVLAEYVIHLVADMFDDWDAVVEGQPQLAEVSAPEAAEVVGHWMRYLPGRGWDDRLPNEPDHRP